MLREQDAKQLARSGAARSQQEREKDIRELDRVRQQELDAKQSKAKNLSSLRYVTDMTAALELLTANGGLFVRFRLRFPRLVYSTVTDACGLPLIWRFGVRFVSLICLWGT